MPLKLFMSQENTESCGGAAPKPCREKYWSELNPSEREARMRKVIKDQDRAIARMEAKLYQLETRFDLHTHQADGAGNLLFREPAYNRAIESAGRRIGDKEGDEVYF